VSPRRLAVLLPTVAVLVLAACSTASSPPGAALSGVGPGHASPGAAFAGWVDAVVKGQLAKACGYVPPDQQAACPGDMAQQHTTVQGAAVRLGKTDIKGDRALIVPLGTVCINGGCRTNTDPNLGIPPDASGFEAAYQTALRTNILTTPCLRISGLWYVDLGAQTNAPI